MSNILIVIVSFYALQSMKGTAMMLDHKNGTAWKHSHMRFTEDLDKLLDFYTHQLAHLLFDFTFSIIGKELSHCYDQCAIIPDSKSLPNSKLPVGNSIVQECDANSFLKFAEKLFIEEWEWDYGGYKWAKIARYCSNYGKVDDTIFIDNIIDLEHNTASIFCTPGLHFHYITDCDSNELHSLLDDKFFFTPYKYYWKYQNWFLPYVSRLYSRFFNLYYPDYPEGQEDMRCVKTHFCKTYGFTLEKLWEEQVKFLEERAYIRFKNKVSYSKVRLVQNPNYDCGDNYDEDDFPYNVMED